MEQGVKQVIDRLEGLGFGEHWEGFITPLSKTLSDQDKAEIIIKTGDANQWTTFVLDLEKNASELSFPSYKGTFIKVPDFEHKVINGIDSEALESLMQRLDWRVDFVKLEEKLEQSGKGITDRIRDYHKVVVNLTMLGATDEGKLISDALKIRYLVGTPYEERYISPELKERCVNERTFFASNAFAFTKDEASNLLEGRAVLKNYLDEDGSKQKDWFKPLPGEDTIGEKNILFSGRQGIYPVYDLSSVIKTLPLVFKEKEERGGFIKSLQQGGLIEINIPKSGKEETYFMEAWPEAKSIRLYDASMKPITRKEMLLDYKDPQKKKLSKGRHL